MIKPSQSSKATGERKRSSLPGYLQTGVVRATAERWRALRNDNVPVVQVNAVHSRQSLNQQRWHLCSYIDDLAGPQPASSVL